MNALISVTYAAANECWLAFRQRVKHDWFFNSEVTKKESEQKDRKCEHFPQRATQSSVQEPLSKSKRNLNLLPVIGQSQLHLDHTRPQLSAVV